MIEKIQNTPQPAKIFGLRQSALIELGLFFLVMLLIDWIFLDGTRYFSVSPHPFWIIVLLMSCQYGTNEGLGAALLATVVLLLGNTPEQSIDQDQYDYILSLAANPLMWITAGIGLGELRNKHIRERRRLQEELGKAQTREEHIAEAYDRLKGLKENLETRIAGQFRSSVQAYKAAKSIEKLHPVDVLQGVEELIRAVINPEQFSVYLLQGNTLELTINSGWTDADHYSYNFDANSEIFKQVVGRQTVLCISNSDHEQTLANQGVLAGPLIHRETGEIIGMLKIERMGFLDLNLSSIETFSAICEWVGMAFINARQYQAVKTDAVVNPDHKLYSQAYFRRYTDYIGALANRLGFDVSMIIVKLANATQLGEEHRHQVAISLGEAVNQSLRNVDLAFDYQAEGEEYAIILPATNLDGARIVLDKIKHAVQGTLAKRQSQAQISFTIHNMHEGSKPKVRRRSTPGSVLPGTPMADPA